MKVKLKRVVSGIQPSGVLHLGNYFGAVKNYTLLQEDKSKECFFFIADNHSATNKFLNESYEAEGEKLEKLVVQTAACLLASGVDPKKAYIFNQSSVPAHSELMWILSCMTPLSWLNKMVQFKEKSKGKGNDISNTGLYTYPVLMAADILIYKAQEVPVGEDQIQHIELTRDVAQRVNKVCKKEVFPLPDYILNKASARIMSLQNGKSKMSKSDKNSHSCLSLITTEEDIRAKVMKAKTDSVGKIYYDSVNRPEIANLLNIYAGCNDISVEEAVKKFENASTFEFKQELTKSLCDVILPISYKAKLMIEKEFDFVKDVLEQGKKVAQCESLKTLQEVKKNLNYFL